MSAVTVGAILAGSVIVGSFSGLYSGWLSDKFGRKCFLVDGLLYFKYGLGFAFAPLVGGILIQWGGSTPLFTVCFVLSLVMIGLYKWAERDI